MTEIIQALDDFTEAALPALNKKLWGFVELAHRKNKGNDSISDQPIPMTINGTSDRKQVSLDDRYEFISWMRIPGRIGVTDNDQWSYGFKEARFQTLGIRWVVAHKVELGESLIYSLVDALPEKLSVNGFNFVFINPGIDVDYDHEEIYRTELGNTVYEKHRFPWNLYVINLNVEFTVCEGFISQSPSGGGSPSFEVEGVTYLIAE